MPKPFPAEFRRDVIAVARKGEAPLSQIAKDFGISGSCLHRWLKIGDTDDAAYSGFCASHTCRHHPEPRCVHQPGLANTRIVNEPFSSCGELAVL
jgi:hypothetical protein